MYNITKGGCVFIKSLFYESCKQLGISVDDETFEKLIIYKELLLEWNKKINLTAITDDTGIIQKHFIDSLTVLKCPEIVQGAYIIDVGTGAGFPALPIKIARPDLNVVLMDSLSKRISFLEEVCNKLNLNNVECVHMRAEDGGRNTLYREKFDVCLSRAVADMSVLCEYCLPFVKTGGYFISLKGPDCSEELKAAEKAIETLGGCVTDIISVAIPQSDIKHTIVITKKIYQTPTRFPRKAGKVVKSPIK